MRRKQQRLLSLGVSILGMLSLPPVLMSQALPSRASGTPTDWSHHHVIFSKPGNADQSDRLEKNPRYVQQQRRQMAARFPVVETPVVENDSQTLSERARRHHRRRTRRLRRDWSEDLGSGASVGAGNYPAKYSFQLNTANCASALQPDFTAYGTGLAGSAFQAGIVAYDNLYSGCGGTVPQVYWAYDTGGTVNTSPVLSADGTQLAFIQTDGSGNGNFVVVKWAASVTDTVTSPTLLPRNASYPVCTAPCMTTGFLPNGSGVNEIDIRSSMFYDYASDTAFVGDAAGWLHKISPLFLGPPAEVRSAGWPVLLNPSAPTAVSSPVYDSVSQFVFVTDAGGFLYRVGASSAFVVSSAQLDFSLADGGVGLVQGPIVDSTSESVYVFASSDGSGSCPVGSGGLDCAAIFHLPVAFVPDTTGSEAIVGNSTAGTPPNPLYIGGFDNAYLNSTNGTGNLYVCGNTGGPPTLYRVAIQAGVLGTISPGPVLSTSTTACSPVTDVLNPNTLGGITEWIFASVQTGGVGSSCSAGGCIFNLRNTSWEPLTSFTSGQEVLDTNMHIEVVETAGTSGSAAPFWTTTLGGTTADGSVTWLNQGLLSATTPAAWAASHHYTKGTEILDPAGDIELVTSNSGNISGTSIPAFSTVPGGTTTDGTVTWTNVGLIATAALPADGGASGIIYDNTVGSGTLAGASQVYFSTLSNQACGTSGTGGCAVQASQAQLK